MDLIKKLPEDLKKSVAAGCWSSNLHFLTGVNYMDLGMEGYAQWEIHTDDRCFSVENPENIVLHVQISQRSSLTGFGTVCVQLSGNHFPEN